jgi:hypothetical protein
LKSKPNKKALGTRGSASVDFLLCLLFIPEDKGDTLGSLRTTQCYSPKDCTLF